MNVEHQQKLIRFLENLPPERIDMHVIVGRDSGCGTVGCIAGWNLIMQGRNPINNYAIGELETDLDISYTGCQQLCMPDLWPPALRRLYQADRRTAVIVALKHVDNWYVDEDIDTLTPEFAADIQAATEALRSTQLGALAAELNPAKAEAPAGIEA